MNDSFYMDNNRLLGLMQTKIMVVHGSNSKKNTVNFLQKELQFHIN